MVSVSQYSSLEKLFDCSESFTLYNCEKCNFVVNERTQLQTHICNEIDSIRRKVLRKTCKKCGVQSFSQLWNYLHQWKCNEQFKCDQCSFVTYSKRHYLSCRTSKWYYCDHCSYKSRIYSYVKKHRVNSHSLVKFKCDQCTYQISSKWRLDEHIIRKHTAIEAIQWFFCDLCVNKKFKIQRDLQYHIYTQHNERKETFKCDMCYFQAKRKCDLNKHIQMQHTANDLIKFYVCEFCNFKTKYIHNLKYHTECQHFKEKYYKCNDCSYETNMQYKLNKHRVNIHTPIDEIKWHQCNYCDFKARALSNFKRHLARRHGIGEKRHKCDQCTYEACVNAELKHHKQTQHTPKELFEWFKCVHCNGQFKTKQTLRQHMQRKHPN